MTCQNCQKKHPTLLHIEIQNKDSTQASGTAAKQEKPSSALVSMDNRDNAVTGRECALAIVPVRVKLAKSDKTVTTYAFLDPGSSATFCTERLMKHLHAKGRRTDILL